MSKIPKFKTEKEEKEFWLSHDATEYFEEIEDVKKTMRDARPRKIRTTLYLAMKEHDKIRKLAFYNGISMANFIRHTISEKLNTPRLKLS